MNNTKTILWLTVTGLFACAAGCGKSNNATPPSPASEQPATAEAAKPATTPPPQAPPVIAVATNAPQPTPSEPVSGLAQATAPSSNAVAPKTMDATNVVPSLASLSQDQVVKGLQEALGKGLQQAIARLGHDGGFLTNLDVKIPMPEKLQKVESALRAMKEDKLADDFVATMNHAAEQAVPEAGSVFADALKQMSIEDAKSILTGPNDAATQYFQRTTQTNLYARFYPIVKTATEQTGVTAAYKSMVEKVNVGGLTQKLGGLGSAISGTLLDNQTLDLDAYVTNKALDGLFKMVADEEKQIRQNPVARTTELLQTVFGALKNR